MVRCNAVWLLFNLMGLRTRQLLSKRYAGFEWMLKILVDGVKGQTCSSHSLSRQLEVLELAACKTLASDPPELNLINALRAAHEGIGCTTLVNRFKRAIACADRARKQALGLQAGVCVLGGRCQSSWPLFRRGDRLISIACKRIHNGGSIVAGLHGQTSGRANAGQDAGPGR